MRIKFLGAAREVTGSKHLLQVNGKKIFLDYGMLQGQRSETYAKNLATLVDPREIDAVILSHAHIDHSGNLPILIKKGYQGPIYSTFATKDLCSYMLRDCAYIQEKEIEYLNQKLQNKGQKDLLAALYTLPDAENTLKYFQRKVYDSEFPVASGVTAIFRDAGHILGSASVTLNIEDQETGKKYVLVYTGDLGRKRLPILRDPVLIQQADILITESTYGNRLHETIEDVDEKVAAIVNRTAGRGGKIIIPAFALGRTQEVVYTIHKLMNKKAIPDLPIFVDSPLACDVTEVFRNHPECFDRDTYLNFLDKHEDPFGFHRLRYTHSETEDSSSIPKETVELISSRTIRSIPCARA
ncbi:MBL fold metallo-hydrolase, partial [Candidatus Peregrinibacteria bacterium]|nr:MBL fold metallo-hydrolase [Candidatus Peregrinibacteria bacterium]